MLSVNIPELSSTSGELSDGVVKGQIKQSTLEGVFSQAAFSASVTAYRKDVTPVGVNYVDISTQAVSGTVDSVLAFGANTDMTAGDELWVAGSDGMEALFVRVTTPGVYVGDGISVWDSPDGDTLHEITSLVDESDGFRNSSGVYKISFPGHTERKAITPAFGVPKKKFIIIKLKNFTSATTAPKFSRIWPVIPNDSMQWIPTPSVTTADIADNVFTGIPSEIIFNEGTVGHLGFPFKGIGLDYYMYRAIPNVRNAVWEYHASDDTWKALPNIVDETDTLKIGPATLGTTSQFKKVRWTIPSDWTEMVHTHPPDTTQISSYWVRLRTVTVSDRTPVPPALYRVKAKSFGSDNCYGIYHNTAATYRTAVFNIGITSASETKVSLINGSTGVASVITIPANTRSSGSLTGHRADVNLSLNSGDDLLIAWSSGGTIQDVEIVLS